MSWPRRTVELGAGRTAVVVDAPPTAGGDDLLATLRLPAPRGTVVLNGTTAGVDLRLSDVLAGLAGTACRERLTVVTGGTDAGIFSLLGGAMTERSAPLVGVAPRDLVAPPPSRVRLEPHHSHFVLVDGDAWGDETPALLALAGALTRLAPSVAVICGGGPVTRAEALGHLRAGRPLVVVAGSGGVADELMEGGTASAAGPGDLVDAVLGALGV